MDTFIEILTSVKVLGPLGIIAAVEAWALYSLFNRLQDLQDKRLQDYEKMKDEYTQLSQDINRTLDTVLKVIGKKNGNGNGSGTTNG